MKGWFSVSHAGRSHYITQVGDWYRAICGRAFFGPRMSVSDAPDGRCGKCVEQLELQCQPTP